MTPAYLWSDDHCIQYMIVTMRNVRKNSTKYGLWLPGYVRTIPSVLKGNSILHLYPAIERVCAFPIPENEEVDRGYGDGYSLYRPLFFCDLDYTRLIECERRKGSRMILKRKRDERVRI